MNMHEELAAADALNAAYKARIAELEAQLTARQPSDLQAAILALPHGCVGEECSEGYITGWDFALKAAARLAASHAVVGQQWQPIETAPKDGTRILLYGTRYSMLYPSSKIVAGAFERGWWADGTDLSHVTHWMPLPPAPQPAQQEGE